MSNEDWLKPGHIQWFLPGKAPILTHIDIDALGCVCPICHEAVAEAHRHDVRVSPDISKWKMIVGSSGESNGE